MKLLVPPRTLLAPAPQTPPLGASPASLNIVAWLPFLWQRVLFPGRADANNALRVRSLLFVVGVAAVVIFPCLNFHLFEPDEGRYAQIPKEMLARGDWLIPTLQGEPYLDKPPLFYWLVMFAYRAFGTADWVARLVPATAVVGCVIALYVLGRRIVGERAAFWSALFASLTPGLVSMGRILVLDGMLTLFVTIAMLSAFLAVRGPSFATGWWRMMCVALAFGALTKGPIAVLLVLPPLLAHRWLTSQRTVISWRAWGELAGIIAVLNLPWLIAISIRHPEFASYFLWKHNLQRFLTPFDHQQPIWYFLPVLLIGLAPIAWLLPLAGRYLLSGRPETALGRIPEMGFFLLAGLWCVGFFSLSGSKLPTYLLPAFPAFCLFVGSYATATGWSERRLFRAGLLIWGSALIVGHTLVLPKVAWQRSPMNHPAEARPFLDDRSIPVYCYPRPVDSVAFYLERDDFRVYRSKELAEMLQSMDKHSRSIVLFAHRNSKLILTHNVPPHFRVVYVSKLGLCDMAVIER
jgi:4-amino-4-deoxy-L-arabinose transferase-like glycosyltransferase